MQLYFSKAVRTKLFFLFGRTTRERAEAALGGSGVSGSELTQRWRAEWEALYPDLDIDWKQVVSRHNYHFGSERRESQEFDRPADPPPR